MTRIDSLRVAAESDLYTFIRLVAPHRVLGACHEELLRWWTREEAEDHQLVLMPRDHQKSAMVAYRVAWTITKDPCSTFLYISSTSGLAEEQLYFIKAIMTSKIYRRYWPQMMNTDEGKREKWTNSEIKIDHPDRKEAAVRDPTIKTAGLTTNIVGLHFSHAVLDDIVTNDNAYTEEGRGRVRSQYALLSSIESTGTDKDSSSAQEWVVGTRYHPRDLYSDIIEMTEDVYSTDGELVGQKNIYEIWQREVEDRGDGSGEFLWPRQQNSLGKWYGFNREVLAKKRGKYRINPEQYRAQYYNNPNDPDNEYISSFQYYDKRHLEQRYGSWYFKDRKLNVYAAIDFAFSLSKRADYTAIVVVGIDSDKNVYILDIDRFKTDGKPSQYFKHILEMHQTWEFRKIRAEINSGQKAIVESLKESYIKPYGLMLSIDEKMQTRHEGTKEERNNAILEPRYSNDQIWHYKGGYCQMLEEELRMVRPPHDDIKDALAAAVDVAIAPITRNREQMKQSTVVYNTRFGGVQS